MKRIVVIVLAVLASLLGLAAPTTAVAMPSDSPVAHAHVYDGRHGVGTPSDSVTERGPPAAYDHAAIDDAADRWLRGASARSDAATPRAVYTYDDPAPLVRPARAVATTQGQAWTTGSRVVVLEASGVAAKSGRKVAIGEDMTNRVEPFAKKIGADTYKADPTAPREMWMENNRSWIRKQMDDGCTIYDCGPAPGRANFPGPTSPYYRMELEELRNYPNYIRVR